MSLIKTLARQKLNTYDDLVLSMADQLKGYWPIDEVNGTTIRDLSGRNAHGTIEGTYVYDQSPGPISKESRGSVRADFASAPDFALINVPGNNGMNTGGAVTINGWWWPGSNNVRIQFGRIGGGLGYNYQLWAGSGDAPTQIGQHDGINNSVNNLPGVPSPFNRWVMITGVRQADGLTWTLYYDGIEQDTRVLSYASPGEDSNLRIISLSGAAQIGLGKLARVAQWHRPLNSQEVISLYLAGVNGVI